MERSEAYYRRHLPHYQPEGETYHVVFRLAGSIPADVVKELRLEREHAEKRILKVENERERTKLLCEYRWEYFERFEKLLEGNSRGPFWLRKPEIAEIVAEAIHYRDKKEYDLIAHSIMPNHVHMIFELVDRRDKENGAGNVRRTDNLRERGRDGVPSYNKIVCRVADPTKTVTGNVLRQDAEEGTTNVRRADCTTYTVTNILRKLKWNTALRANKILGRTGAFWQDESYDRVIRNSEELDRTIEYVLTNPVKAGLCKDWHDWKWSFVKEGYIGD